MASSVNVQVFRINKSPQATAAVLGETLNYCIKLPTQLFPSKTVGLVQRRVLCATVGRRAANAESSKKPSSSKENKDMQKPLKVCVNQPAEVRTLLKLRKPTASFKRLQPPNSDTTSHHLEDFCHQKDCVSVHSILATL